MMTAIVMYCSYVVVVDECMNPLNEETCIIIRMMSTHVQSVSTVIQ